MHGVAFHPSWILRKIRLALQVLRPLFADSLLPIQQYYVQIHLGILGVVGFQFFCKQVQLQAILVMMVGFPLFMQTTSTSNFMHWLPRPLLPQPSSFSLSLPASATDNLLQPKLKSILSNDHVDFRDTHRRATARCFDSRICCDLESPLLLP